MSARRFAPALALVVAMSASGCASFSVGCGGLGSVDPMSDGASRLNPAFQRFQQRSQTLAMQQKAMVRTTFYQRDLRRPGMPMEASNVAGGSLCR